MFRDLDKALVVNSVSMLLSGGVGGLELSRNDFVPESDSDDDDKLPADESVGKSLVEETQTYDDDGDVAVDGDTLTADVTPHQVILYIHCL